ncbi:MAG: DedA family protein [Thermomicrobiales bacterium]
MGDLIGGIASWATDVIEKLGYAGLAMIIALENVFPPIPSEAVLPLAGFLTGQGRMSFPLAVLAATLGAVVGALALYGVGYWFGDSRLRWLVRKYGRLLGVSEADLDKANTWFDKHGARAVLFCRVVPIVRSLISIPAGIRRMPLLPFVGYTALGAGVWNTILIGAGWWLGDRWEDVEQYVGYLQYVVIVAVIAFGVWWIWKRNPFRTRTTIDAGR